MRVDKHDVMLISSSLPRNKIEAYQVVVSRSYMRGLKNPLGLSHYLS